MLEYVNSQKGRELVILKSLVAYKSYCNQFSTRMTIYLKSAISLVKIVAWTEFTNLVIA